jgi:small subunit ribosomal protein S24e
METEVISKKENPLMRRTEVRFKLTHPKEGTPRREAVRDNIAKLMNVPKDRVVIDHLTSEFGKVETVGYAKIYISSKDAVEIEQKYILVRNRLVKKDGKEKEKVEKEVKEKEEEVKKEEKVPKKEPEMKEKKVEEPKGEK